MDYIKTLVRYRSFNADDEYSEYYTFAMDVVKTTKQVELLEIAGKYPNCKFVNSIYYQLHLIGNEEAKKRLYSYYTFMANYYSKE